MPFCTNTPLPSRLTSACARPWCLQPVCSWYCVHNWATRAVRDQRRICLAAGLHDNVHCSFSSQFGEFLRSESTNTAWVGRQYYDECIDSVRQGRRCTITYAQCVALTHALQRSAEMGMILAAQRSGRCTRYVLTTDPHSRRSLGYEHTCPDTARRPWNCSVW